MSIVEPSKIITPWAESGMKNPIPPLADNTTGAAGFDLGFPDVTMTPPEAGGIPPAGQDFNGILFSLSEAVRYVQAGTTPTYSSALSVKIGGYPRGAVVCSQDGTVFYENRADSNTSDPYVNGSGWFVLSPAKSLLTLSVLKAKSQDENSPWGQPGPINILGDSISFGYFASYENGARTNGGIFYHRWASILARMLSGELNNGHYITANPNIYEYGGDEDIIKRTATSGSWVGKNTGLYTSNLLIGQATCATVVGDYMEFTAPSTFNECWIYYVVQPGGGEMSISQNGGTPIVLDCNNVAFKNSVLKITLVPNPQGYTVLRFTKTGSGSGEVGISAISPTPGVRETGFVEGGALNVFAAPGRRLQDLSEMVISDSCNNAAAMILALGFNDNPLNGTGQEAGRANFTLRINWVIQYCNQHGTPLIVPDFSWKNESESFTRSELRRAAYETNGIYIPFPDMIKLGSFPSESFRLSTGMWQDSAHPCRPGHKWIAETIAKAIGLGCASKNEAIRLHDYWVSLPLTTTYSNILTNIPRNLAAYRVCADSIQIRTQIKITAGGNFPAGISNICGATTNAMFWIVPPCKFSSYYLTKLHAVDENTGVILGYSALTGSGTARGILSLTRPSGVSSPSFNGASSFEIEKWESYNNV